MDNQAKLIVFQSQTKNVRSLRSSMRQVHRSINGALRTNNIHVVATFTKIYALLFCAWAEANFSKILHTPYGFDDNEIEQVQTAKKQGIQQAWKRCVSLGLQHLDAKRGSFLPNAQQKLERTIESHVFEPSLLRNKLAHGQWEVALNRTNDAISNELTIQISNLNMTVIDGWIRAHELLAHAIETLIESPKKAFVRDWWVFVVNLEEEMQVATSRSFADHVAKLKAKDLASDAATKRLPT